MSSVTVTSLVASDVTKTFASNIALDRVSIEIRAGEVHGLVGGNGSGKSTLIKILAGVYQADRGEIRHGEHVVDAAKITPEWARSAGLRFVHQDPAIVPALTVGENMALGSGFPTRGRIGIRWGDLYQRTQSLLDRYEIPVSARTMASDLQPAERTMVAIARAFADGVLMPGDARDDGILVLDEPTASLTAHEVDHLLAAVRRVAAAGTGVVYVSHRQSEVVELSDRVTALRDGRIAGTAEGEDLTEDRVIELMVGRTLEMRPKQADEVKAGEDVVLEARDVHDGHRVNGASLALRRGEILGIAGLVGCGGTQLLEMLFGAHRVDAGEILIDGEPARLTSIRAAMDAGIAYVPEDRAAKASFGAMTVRENLSAAEITTYWERLWMRGDREKRDAADLIGRYGVVAESDGQPLATLSGGNQQKVVLARWLRRKPKILLLDEPTQGVDVGARANIYDAIRAAVHDGTSIMIASSDADELAILCDRVVIMYRGRVTGQLVAPHIDPERIAALAMRPGSEEVPA